MKPAIRLGLDRVRRALEFLGRPEESFASVLVAGTNGKGSVSAMVESVLRGAGLRTGLFTSPHLVDVRERVRAGGRPISIKDWRRLERRVLALGRRRRLGLTEFEVHTLIAFLYFRERAVDIAVVEVGLGGRLDATNALPAPEATVITSIGHDHMAWLGNSLKKVFFEKAGIARPGTPMFLSLPNSLGALARRHFSENAVPIFELGREIRTRPHRVDWKRGRQSFDLALPGARYGGLEISLMGKYQVGNAALAAAVCHSLRRRGWPLTEGHIRRGLLSARWPGRFQLVPGKPPLILDGAHNLEAAASLAAAYRASPWAGRKATLIFSCLKDKDAPGLVRCLRPLAGRVLTVDLPTERGRSAEELARLWGPRTPARAFSDVRAAWRLAKKDRSTPVLAAGSLYLIGLVMKMLE